MANLDLVQLQERVQRARSAAKDGNLPAARELLEGIVADLAAAGIESPFVEWLSAVTADGLELFVEATTRIERACRRDPACPTFANSRVIIYRRARDALLAAARSPTDAGPLELYQVLVRANEADRDAHMAALAICSATGQEARAEAIATGLRALYPESQEALLTAIYGTTLDCDVDSGPARGTN